jgi:hypothetical protein
MLEKLPHALLTAPQSLIEGFELSTEVIDRASSLPELRRPALSCRAPRSGTLVVPAHPTSWFRSGAAFSPGRVTRSVFLVRRSITGSRRAERTGT